VLDANASPLCKKRSPDDRVPQLAHVARPIMGREQGEGCFADPR
jgi:hypothetical protein